MKGIRHKYKKEPLAERPAGDSYPISFWCTNCGHLIEFEWTVKQEVPETIICSRCECVTYTREMQEEKN